MTFSIFVLLVSCAERFDGWEALYRPTEAQVRDLASDGESLYLATLGDGVYSSSDWGVTWNRLAGTEGLEVHCLACAAGGLLIGADSGVYVWGGGKLSPGGLQGRPIWSLTSGEDGALAGGVGAVFVQTASGWEELTGLPDTAVTAVLEAAGVLYAGTLGEGLWALRESAGEEDVSRRWVQVTGTPEMPLDAAEVTLLRYVPDTGRLYVGTMWGGLFVSEDGGFYKLCGLDPEFKYVSGLVFAGERLFITTCGIRADGLYSADPDGRNWRLWPDSPYPARGAVLIPDGRILVATEREGLFAAYPPETDRLKPGEGDE
ncbi:MAG: hypothetical protein A2Y64_08010 [Candidatus Coatesbacteria bacterium RBG_13_66_14]|uniref:Photosynthesis system II assembly factor Ycf48/Hcf136-like domain-containing protein n=1 Tax=Candidatus Coatesbacteria bacterium RBG_13_66_14 TaxID=1817816 RepID=A0A1F5FJ43_9BACT|nr:MAG: hypothetical protein A2Y64_08010 [Candidatus Coatesbacteria bacterium RBG_13_66_14]